MTKRTLKKKKKKKHHGHSCESQSVNEQMNSKTKWIQKTSPFLGPAGTGMSCFKRGAVSGDSDLVQEGSAGRAAVEGIRRHHRVLSADRIIPCLEDAWTSADVFGRISLLSFWICYLSATSETSHAHSPTEAGNWSTFLQQNDGEWSPIRTLKL